MAHLVKERRDLFDGPEPPADNAGKAAHEQYKMMLSRNVMMRLYTKNKSGVWYSDEPVSYYNEEQGRESTDYTEWEQSC
jgi:hypothetical protein